MENKVLPRQFLTTNHLRSSLAGPLRTKDHLAFHSLPPARLPAELLLLQVQLKRRLPGYT